MTGPVMAYGSWATNAELIVDVVRLGYLRPEWVTWDATFGEGTFWRLWRPDSLIGTDLDPAKSDKILGPVDFTNAPWKDRSFDCVVLDAPYKLNGKPDPVVDTRYGVHERRSRDQRLTLLVDGVAECARVVDEGFLLVKCMDQVEGGKVRWQTDLVTEKAKACGLGKVDRFDIASYRPQPSGRSQIHARRNASTLLVFKRGWSS